MTEGLLSSGGLSDSALQDLITQLVFFFLRKSSSALMYSTQNLPHPGGRVPKYSYSLPLCRMWPAVTVTFLLKSLRHTVDEDICIIKPPF